MMTTNHMTAGPPLASFGEALRSGVWTNANADPFSCHHTFEGMYVYQADVNVVFNTILIVVITLKI